MTKTSTTLSPRARTAIVMRARRVWMSRWVLAALGVSLALVCAAGFPLFHWLGAADAPDAGAFAGKSQLVTLAVFATCAASIFGVIGWALGCEVERLEATAGTDPLTIVPNRRGFEARAAAELARTRARRQTVALALIDVDNLKAKNERDGKSAGDEALCIVARIVTRCASTRDVIARWGDDELVLFMTQRRAQEALVFAERIRRAIHQASDGALSVSIGVADDDGEPRSDVRAIVAAAERALRRAKQRGKNCTCSAERRDWRAPIQSSPNPHKENVARARAMQ
jgi:diguanylate cyclase (GGDEF)-like protein